MILSKYSACCRSSSPFPASPSPSSSSSSDSTTAALPFLAFFASFIAEAFAGFPSAAPTLCCFCSFFAALLLAALAMRSSARGCQRREDGG
jgi:hypothetical protein